MSMPLACLCLMVTTNAFAVEPATRDELAAFPVAEFGMVRHVIRLSPLEHEDRAKVELIVGQTITTRDALNHMRLPGTIAAEDIPGWGYTRYVVRVPAGQQGLSTMMAIPDDSPEIQRFVPAVDDYLVRYNSRLPLVVYAPVGSEVRYRLWSAGPTETAPGK